MEKELIKLESVSKKFKNKLILNEVSLKVNEGEVIGVIGVNGSGKSTLIKIILGLLDADSGSTELLGSNDPEKIDKRRIGVVFDNHGLFPGFSVNKNLRLIARMKECSQEDIDKALAQVDMEQSKHEKISKLSFGMKQRVAFAAALISNPELIILDEPTNGIDVNGVIGIRKIVSSLAKQGKTVVIASHHLSELEKICSRIVVIDNGVVSIDTSYDSLVNQYGNLENMFTQKV